MSKKNITSIKTIHLEEIFGEDSSKVKYVIDSSPFMMKDSEEDYCFLSAYVENSMMAHYTAAKVLDMDLSDIPDFDEDEKIDTNSNSPGLRSS